MTDICVVRPHLWHRKYGNIHHLSRNSAQIGKRMLL